MSLSDASFQFSKSIQLRLVPCLHWTGLSSFEMAPRMSVNFISLVTSCHGLQEEALWDSAPDFSSRITLESSVPYQSFISDVQHCIIKVAVLWRPIQSCTYALFLSFHLLQLSFIGWIFASSLDFETNMIGLSWGLKQEVKLQESLPAFRNDTFVSVSDESDLWPNLLKSM